MNINRVLNIAAVILFSVTSMGVYANSSLTSASDDGVAQTTSSAKLNASSDNLKLSTEKVNVNNANAEQLSSLKGVGAQKAQAIIEYRTEHGSFKSLDDLQNIKGFSPKVVANLQKNNPDRLVAQ